MKKIIPAIALIAALCAGTADARPVRIGQPAPDFTLTLLDGSKVTLADLKGQVVVLNFWATWCVPCRKELPLLDAYYGIQKAAGLRVFAIENGDEGSVPYKRLKPFLATLTIPSALTIRGPYRPLGAIPTNFVIDRAGVVRYAKAATFDLDALNGLLVPLLREDTPPPAAP